MTTTNKTPAELIREGEIQQGAELLQVRRDTYRRIDDALHLGNSRERVVKFTRIAGDNYVVETAGGPFADKYGNTFRIIVAGSEPKSRAYVTFDHAVLAVIAYRNGADYAGSVFAARALGVEIGFE